MQARRTCSAPAGTRWAVALVLSSAALGAPAQAAAAPRRGDWEATGSGTARGSFALVVVSQRVHRYLAVKDLVVDAPISCQNPSGPTFPVDVEVIGGTTRLPPNGGFSRGRITKGNGTIVRGRFSGGKFAITYRHVSSRPNEVSGGTEVCDTRTIRLTARHGNRHALTNGMRTGQTARGESVALNVGADGRALVAPRGLASNGTRQSAFQVGLFNQKCSQFGCDRYSDDPCAWPVSLDEEPAALFVDSDGTFGNSEWRRGNELFFAGAFTRSGQAAGQFTNSGEGCPPTTWAAGPK